MAHQHDVRDTDIYLKIDPRTKKISEFTKKLILGDHNSERFTFEIPRYIEDHDMTLCDKIEVHFTNMAMDIEEVSEGVYKVDDIELNTEDESVAIFTWLIDKRATKYEGILSFAVRFACTSNGVETYVWSTDDNDDCVTVEATVYHELSEEEKDVYDDNLNIAYGLKYPTDTSKLWLRMNKPESVVVTPELQGLSYHKRMNVKYEIDNIVWPDVKYYAYSVVGNKFYMFGGIPSDMTDSASNRNPVSDTISCLDMETGEMRVVNTVLPNPRCKASAVTIGTKIYIASGLRTPSYLDGDATLYCFDTETETISSIRSFITNRYNYDLLVVGAKIYMVGGASYNSNYTKHIDMYNTETGEYKSFDNILPTGRSSGTVAVAVGEGIYIADVGDSSSATDHRMYKFDTITETMSIVWEGELNTGYLSFQSLKFALGDIIYALDTNASSSWASGWCFNTKDCTVTKEIWDSDTIPGIPDNVNGLFIVDNSRVLIIRSSKRTGEIDPNIYEFYEEVLGEPFNEDQLHLHTTLDGDLFRLINTDKCKMDVNLLDVYRGTGKGTAVKVNAYLYKDGAWKLV